MSGSSSTAHSTVYINLTASTEKLDSYSTARHPGTCSQPRQPRQLLDRSSTGSTGKASTAPRQSTRQRLDGASTARQLDSQGSRRSEYRFEIRMKRLSESQYTGARDSYHPQASHSRPSSPTSLLIRVHCRHFSSLRTTIVLNVIVD